VSTALDYLARLESNLKSRMELLKSANCKDITAFLELPAETRMVHERKVNFHGAMSRTITVIDEAAELFMAGEKSQAANVQKAKSLAIKIAAQGRAVGLHLVIATQRPDVRAVDGQIKANLPGALAFQMPNYASSMTILDNTRAAHLPKVPGRAVWKSGLEMVELQTPFLDIAGANLLLEPYRLKPKDATNEGL
jgi:DNA segregation ATPase FtsK/SpoIIIE, S-DNA-T family